MEFSAQFIADYLQGKIEGDGSVLVNNFSKIEEGKPGTLSFLANPVYTKYIYTTAASVVLVNNDFQPDKEVNTTLIRVDDAYQSLARLLDFYERIKRKKHVGISSLAYIHENAKIGKNVYISGFAYISEGAKIGDNVKIFPNAFIGENVVIGDNTVINAGVTIYEDCYLGNNCIIHSGTVIGSDGFGFAPKTNENSQKVPQVGNVVLEDHVEIGSNTTIDRATLGSTQLKKGVKLDNLIQIGHNVEIGERTVMAAQVGVSGSTKIGKDCMIGGQVGFAGHLYVADKVRVAAQSGIGHSINEEGRVFQGSPALDLKEYQRSFVVYKKLPELYREIDDLKKEIEELKKQNNQKKDNQ